MTDIQETETRKRHWFMFYGHPVQGYGPSMDPHVCGDPAEPCETITEVRDVGPWNILEKVKKP